MARLDTAIGEPVFVQIMADLMTLLKSWRVPLPTRGVVEMRLPLWFCFAWRVLPSVHVRAPGNMRIAEVSDPSARCHPLRTMSQQPYSTDADLSPDRMVVLKTILSTKKL